MKKKLKAFTLVELIIVIAIIAILIMVAIPQYNKAKASAVVSAHNSNVQAVKSAAIMADLHDGDVSKFASYLEGETVPEVPSEIPGPDTYTVSKGSNGEINVSPGLAEYTNGQIQLSSGN